MTSHGKPLLIVANKLLESGICLVWSLASEQSCLSPFVYRTVYRQDLNSFVWEKFSLHGYLCVSFFFSSFFWRGGGLQVFSCNQVGRIHQNDQIICLLSTSAYSNIRLYCTRKYLVDTQQYSQFTRVLRSCESTCENSSQLCPSNIWKKILWSRPVADHSIYTWVCSVVLYIPLHGFRINPF